MIAAQTRACGKIVNHQALGSVGMTQLVVAKNNDGGIDEVSSRTIDSIQQCEWERSRGMSDLRLLPGFRLFFLFSAVLQ